MGWWLRDFWVLRRTRRPLATAVAGLACLVASSSVHGQTVSVSATAETEPTVSGGDGADDPAIWVHPSDPALSVVIGTDKRAGIGVYDLAGTRLQFLADGELNNADVRYDFPLGASSVDLVAASNGSVDGINVYALDPDTRELTSVAAGGSLPTTIGVYGFCLYRSPQNGEFYAFVNSQEGEVQQWRLVADGAGAVGGLLVRSFDVGTQTEGCVADDENEALYIGEEEFGIWRYGAEPSDGEARSLVDVTGAGGHLTADVEGLALYSASDGGGYLIASSQGSDEYVIYRREEGNAYVGTFQIVNGNGIDGTSSTDGIDATSATLGPSFANGLFVAHDGSNVGGRQNYKLVPWEAIAQAFSPALTIDPGWDPRAQAATCADGVDRDGDGYVDFPEDPGCESAADPWERSELLPCDDGLDDDGDGRTDFDPVTFADPGDESTPPAGQGDPGCFTPSSPTESPQCQDGIDNDADGRIDYDAGLAANGFADPAGPDVHCAGQPGKNREAKKSCGLGFELALLLLPTLWARQRRRA